MSRGKFPYEHQIDWQHAETLEKSTFILPLRKWSRVKTLQPLSTKMLVFQASLKQGKTMHGFFIVLFKIILKAGEIYSRLISIPNPTVVVS